MKKIALRILVTILVATLLVTMLAGCRRDEDSLYEPPEFVYVPEFIDLPDELADIRNLVHFDGKLFFTSQIVDEETWAWESKLFSINIDGTGFAELPNYRPSSPPVGAEDALGSMNIMALNIDGDGNLWVVEAGHFYRFDLPDDFDGDDWERWDSVQDLGTVMNMRKLDSTGAELSSLDLQNLPGVDLMWVSAFNIDSDNNIYIGSDMDVIVLSSEADLLFTLQSQNWVEQLIRMVDGSIATIEWGDTGRVVRKIDAAAREWGETVELPPRGQQVFSGTEDFPLIFMDETGLHSLDSESGESVMLLNWIESNVAINHVQHISVLSDGRILCINESWDRRTGASSLDLILLTRTPYAELPERTVLTLATLWLSGELRSQVVEFNRTNPNYRISVLNYDQFNTAEDWQAGLTRLTTDIITGNIPDILDVSNLPFAQYAARGLLVDLYTFIDSDPELSRDSFLESVFGAAEMDGRLYRVFPSFIVRTLIGNPAVLGPEMGWNMDEFLAVLDANPQADMPIGQWLTRERFFQEAVFLGIDEYVDWANGNVYFDTGAFQQLLELANRFPPEADLDIGGPIAREWVDESELIAQGRQIMDSIWLGDLEWIQFRYLLFGGEIVFKGFPTESRNGNYLTVSSGLAITTRATDKDGAWEFLRTSLTHNWQRENIDWGFPTNKAAFEEVIERSMTERESGPVWTWINNQEVELKPLTRAQADQIVALIYSIGGIASHDQALMDIINEVAGDFFNGRTTAQDAARIIQSRASMLIAERS